MKSPSTKKLAMAVLAACSVLAVAVPARADDSIPGASNAQVNGVNVSGTVVGVNNAKSTSFEYTPGGSTTTVSVPGAQQNAITVTGINDAGTIAGYYTNSSNAYVSFSETAGGTVTTYDPFSNNDAFAYGINNAGQVYGSVLNSSYVQEGFIYQNGSYTYVAPPSQINGVGVVGLTVKGINASGEIIGNATAYNGSYYTQPFIDQGGVFSTVPSSVLPGSGGSQPILTAINAAGDVSGTYYDSVTASTNAFVYDTNAGTAQIVAPPTGVAGLTKVTAVGFEGNDLVTSYQDVTGTTYLTDTAVAGAPMPAMGGTLPGLVAGLLGLASLRRRKAA